jgi:perosamine synthetase
MIPHSKPYINWKDIQSVQKIMKTGLIARGDKVSEFEKAVSAYLKLRRGFATGSGTAALILALKALKVGNGDEVILPTYVCHSVFDAIRMVGAKPVLCDVGKHWNMTIGTVAQVFSKRTKAIVVVHIFGIAEDARPFKRFNVPIIEDCCQTFGGSVNGRLVGTIGDICILSFHAIKCLTTGEGGMALSNNDEINNRMQTIVATNRIASPMTNIQASLGLSQIARYSTMLNKRRLLATKYIQYLPHEIVANIAKVAHRSMFYRFPILIRGDFDKIREYCEKKGFAVRKGVDSLIHRKQKISDERFPTATKLFNTTLSLPIYPALSSLELNKIIGTICDLTQNIQDRERI